MAFSVISYGLYKTNEKGFSGRWTLYITEILEDQGVHAELDSFQYSITEGISTKSLTVFCPDDPSKKLVHFNKVVVGLENENATKGKFDINRITLHEGEGWIDLKDEDNNRIHITDINCSIDFSKGHDMIIEAASGNVNGIPVTLKGTSLAATRPKEKSEKEKIQVPEVIRRICQVLYEVQTSPTSSPTVAVDFLVEPEKENGLILDVTVKGNDFVYRGLDFRSLDAILHYENKVLTLSKMDCLDDSGPLSMTGSLHVSRLNSSFEIYSETNLPKILRAFSIESIANELITPRPPIVQAKGAVKGTRDTDDPNKVSWELEMHGHIKLEEFRMVGTVFNSMDTDFSWRDNQLFLRDMLVKHDEGIVKGKILMYDKYIRYEATSNLPPKLYKPFIKEDGTIARNIEKTTFGDNSIILLNLKGSMLRDQLDNWEAIGSVHLENISYNGVPLIEAGTDFNFSPSGAIFSNIATNFGYNKYIPSAYAQTQPSSGTVYADEVSFSPETRLVSIDNLRGKAWIAPVINLFSKSIGSFIDKTAYMTAPPSFSANGAIAMKSSKKKTDLVCNFQKPTSLYYTFLGQDVLFQNTKGTVHLLGRDVLLNEMSAKVLGGSLLGNFRISNKSSQKPKGEFAGNIVFTQMALADIADRYNFKNKTDGSLTGRMSFLGKPNNISTLNGEGFLALDQADLFYIPVFGPLSPIMSGILGDKKSSHEHVNSVSASFVIKSGQVLTNDISSTTPSAAISGKGLIDLNTKKVDLAVQASTKGILGFITLPLKPFEDKLFLFRGTGPFSAPEWKNATFDNIPEYLPESNSVNKAIILD